MTTPLVAQSLLARATIAFKIGDAREFGDCVTQLLRNPSFCEDVAFEAIARGRLDELRLCIDYLHVNPNARNSKGFTLLHAVGKVGTVDMAKFLLLRNSSPTMVDNQNGCVATHYAARLGNGEVCLYLGSIIGNHSIPSLKSRRTPLHFAVQGGYSKVYADLVTAGADEGFCDSTGHTAIELAGDYQQQADFMARVTDHLVLTDEVKSSPARIRRRSL